MSLVVDLFMPERRRRAFPTGPWFFRFSFSLAWQRDRKTISEKGAWSRRLVTVCSMKYERGNLIKTFSTRFAWTLTRRLLTQRRQGKFHLLAFWRNIRNWTIFSRFMAMTCTHHQAHHEAIIYANVRPDIDSELAIKISDFMFFFRILWDRLSALIYSWNHWNSFRLQVALLWCVWVYGSKTFIFRFAKQDATF